MSLWAKRHPESIDECESDSCSFPNSRAHFKLRHGGKTNTTKDQFMVSQAKTSLSTTSLLVYCFISFSIPSPSAAEDASLTGTWRHEASKAEATQRDEAIANATLNMGFLMRGRALEQLREATQPWKVLTLTIENDQLNLSANGRSTKITIDGPPTQVSGERGTGTTQARYEDGKLVMVAQTGAGTRTTVFHPSDDGKRLTLEVSLASQKLGKPLRYRETYIRR
jgi:hypothetical protein